MRIKNRYLRNKLAKIKARKRAVKLQGGQFTHKWCYPYMLAFCETYWSVEEQIKNHNKYIDEWWVRGFLSGNKSGHFNAPRWYRKQIERPQRHAVKQVLHNMIQDIDNVDDIEIPHFKQHMNWDWF